MPLLNLPPLTVPKAPNPKTVTQDDIVNWMSAASQALNQFQQGLEAIDAFINSNSQLATGIIEADNIIAGTITADLISTTGAIITVAAQIQDAIITDAKIVNLDGQKIDASTITAVQIAASAITASEVAASAITTTALAASSVTASNIAAGAVTAAKINVSQLSAIAADMGTLTAGTIRGGRIISGSTSAGYTEMGQSGVRVVDGVGRVVASLSTSNNTMSFTTAGGVLNMEQGADLRLITAAADPAEIQFFNSSGVQVFTISGDASPDFEIKPAVSSARVEVGATTGRWSQIILRSQSAMTIESLYQIVLQGGPVRVDGNLRPYTNGGEDLGDASNARWKTIFLTSGMINTTTAAASTAVITAGALDLPTVCWGTVIITIGGTNFRVPVF